MRFLQEGHKGPKTEASAFRILKDIFGVDFASLSKEEQEGWGKRYKRAVKTLNGVAQVYWKSSLVRHETGDAVGVEKDRLAACNACESPERGITDGVMDQSSPTVQIIDSDFCTPERAYRPFPSKNALAAFQSLALGKRAYGKMRKEKALDHLSRAIALDPRLVEAYITRAHVHMYVDPLDGDRAIAVFSKVLEIEPKSAKALYERGLIYSKQGGDRNLARHITGF